MRGILVAATGLAVAALTAACTQEIAAGDTGAADYAQFCASCHGPGGRGDGPAAAGLATPPPDLTQIARRAGGTYPRLQVMGRIHGYSMGMSDSHMPAFGALLEGETVLYDAGDGIPTPTPVRLIALQEHLQRLQE